MFVCFQLFKVYILWKEINHWPKILIFEQNKEEEEENKIKQNKKNNNYNKTLFGPQNVQQLYWSKTEFRTKFVIRYFFIHIWYVFAFCKFIGDSAKQTMQINITCCSNMVLTATKYWFHIWEHLLSENLGRHLRGDYCMHFAHRP